MNIDIEKCPFCGDDAKLIDAKTAHTNAKICCTNCSASVYATTATKAVIQWNSRFESNDKQNEDVLYQFQFKNGKPETHQ